ncbi:MAG: LysR family transcriptional regulator [Eubacteriales bacterium]|nr:LysR family transcriptional regulator [Eubacteriales bacterium]
MKLQQVIYAVEVFRQRSYTKAAQVLYVSQPRLSRALKELEEELGFEIFQRTRHGIQGTTTRGYAFIKQSLE